MARRKRKKHRRSARPRRRQSDPEPSDIPEGYGVDRDEHFSFIAGFTSGGAPYGTLWEDTHDAPHAPKTTADRVLRVALVLPAADRLLVAETLLDSVRSDPPMDRGAVEAFEQEALCALEGELGSRMTSPGSSVPWSQVKKQIIEA